MKKAGGFTKRMVAILLSGMLAVGTFSGTALAAEVQENTVQEEESITTYTVTLDANGGYFENEWDDVLGEYIESTEILNKKIHVGETVTTFPVKEQENAVVTFMGWSLERDGDIVSQGYEEYVPIETCTLYAVWNVDESAVESESSAEDTVGEDIDNQEWSQASDDSQNNHEREPEVTDNSKDDNFVNDDTSLEEKVVEEDATSLTTEQIFEFQEKVKIWKVNNQITIIYDSTEDIQLGYWVYSGITDELLYSGMIAWNEQSSLYFETVDFDVLNGEKHLEDETIDDISIKDIPIRIVLDNGISQFEENISQDTGVVTIIEEEESSDEQISLSWNPIKNVDGYLILASYSDGRVVTFETDDTTNNFSMDKTDVDFLWVTPFLFAENTRIFGDVTVYHLGKSIVSDKDEDTLGNQDQLDMTQEADGENLEKSEEDSQGTVGSIENEPNEKVDGNAETDEILSEGETESVSSEKLFSAINTPLDGDRYTVLLLDNSGSMNNASRLVIAKQAAIKFCEQMLAADGVNYISIVGYSKNINSASDFMEDISSLQSIINSMTASGDTNMNAALLQAVSLLNFAPEDAVKNIILLSDGIPQTGSYIVSGRYSSSDSTDYYKYGNAVYETAKSINPEWNIYTLGFFQDLSSQDLLFARLLMEDIQNHGYYDVTSADDLNFTFEQIVKDITTNITIEETEGIAGKLLIIKAEVKSSKIEPESNDIIWSMGPEKLTGLNSSTDGRYLVSLEKITWGATTVTKRGQGKYTITVPVTVSLPGVYDLSLYFDEGVCNKKVIIKPAKVIWKDIESQFKNGLVSGVEFTWTPSSFFISEFAGYEIRYCNNNDDISSSSTTKTYKATEANGICFDKTIAENISVKKDMKAQIRGYVNYNGRILQGEWSQVKSFSVWECFFKIGIDSNSFSHTPPSFGYSQETESYDDLGSSIGTAYPVSQELLGKLNEGTFSGKTASLEDYISKKGGWGGSCHGLTMSLALAKMGKMDVTKYNVKDGINKNRPEYYYDLAQPGENLELREKINYYYLTQMMDYGKSYAATSNRHSLIGLLWPQDQFEHYYSLEDYWSMFIEALKEALSHDSPIMFGMGKLGWGHAILACGYEVSDDESYIVVTCFDPNSKNKYVYLYIGMNKEWFFFGEKRILNDTKISTGAVIDDFYEKYPHLCNAFGGAYGFVDNWIYFQFWRYDDLCEIEDHLGTESNNQEYIEITTTGDSEFKLLTKEKLSLNYESFNISGDMPAHISFINNEDDINAESEIQLYVPISDELSVKNNEDFFAFSCTFPEKYYRISGDNIKSVAFNQKEGIVVDGNSPSFDIAMSSPDLSDLIKISGSSSGDQILFIYENNDIRLSSEGYFSNVTVDIHSTNGTNDRHYSIENQFSNTLLYSDIVSEDNLIYGDITGTIIETGSCGENAAWTLYQNGTLLISGYGEMKDYRLMSPPWKEYASSITSVVVDQGITYIGAYSFGNMNQKYAIKRIFLSNTVEKIGEQAFGYLEYLSEIRFSKRLLEIGDAAFSHCTKIESISLPPSITKIGKYAFNGCEKLKNILLPNGIKEIREGTFSYCNCLKEITIPNSVTSIGELAFFRCNMINKLTIPSNVTFIGFRTFSCCERLGTIVFKGDAPTFYKSVSEAIPGVTAFNGSGSVSIHYLYGKKGWYDAKTLDWSSVYITWVEEGTPDYIPIGDAEISNISDLIYTGSNLEQQIVVKVGEHLLVEGKDYDISYQNNIGAGTATIMLSGKGIYTGTKTGTFEIMRASIANSTVTDVADRVYTGEALTQRPTLTIGEATLIEGTDYSLSYANNTDAGSAKMIITGVGNYVGEIIKVFSIKGASIEGSSIAKIADETFTSSALTPSPSVTVGTIKLEKDIDYSISYSNNINAGTAILTITGRGNYSGSTTTSFIINPASIIQATITGISRKTYTGTALTLSPTVKVGDTVLTQETDYTLSYSNNTKAGTAIVTITGIGNYEGTITKTFTINPASLTTATVTGISDETYTGKALTQSPVVTLGTTVLNQDADYRLSYTNNTNVGTATVTITGIGNYAGTISKTFTISGISIANATLTGISNKTYTGLAQTQNPTVKVGDKTLTKDTDYTLSYNNNTNVGTATVTITGKGNYAGTISKTFTISGISIANSTVTGISNKTYSGSAQTQNPTVKVGDKSLTNGTDYTLSYSDNTNVGTATVTITGKGNYAGTRTEIFEINKANQSITVQSTSSSVAVGKTATVSIIGAKGTTSFKSSDTSVAVVNTSTGVVTGKKAGTVTITVTAAATANYNAASKTVKITVTEPKTLKKPGNCHFTKWNNSKYTSCRISWNKVNGAEGYQTLLSWTNGSNASRTIVKSNVLYRDCTVHPQHVSQMMVRAFYMSGGKRVFGPWSNVEYITPSPTKLTAKNASSGTNLKMNISWNIIYGCNGYNVFLTTNPNGTWYWNQSTTTKADATSAAITKYRGSSLKKNTRYYVRIVTRRQRNGVFCTVPMPASNTYIGSFIIK